jgi:D-glucuronyl C5-epimerase C-terminus
MPARRTRRPARRRNARKDPASRRLRVAIATLAGATLLALSASSTDAPAAPVILVGAHGAAVRDDPAVGADTMPSAAPERAGLAGRTPARNRGFPRTVRGTLGQLHRAGQIPQATYRADLGAFNGALAEVKRLPGARGTELEAVIENLHGMAVGGTLTASRLPVLFLTLARNRQYWASHPVLSYGQRVEFAGSQLVWEYYPGQGLQLQVLGSFGKADWLCSAGSAYAPRCQAILSELLPLAVHRAGGLVWEYYFDFDGGTPPWTSAMSQATALQTLADAYKETGDQTYLTIAHDALPALNTPPPTGVAVRTNRGLRFVQYSFQAARDDEIINAFLQTLIGLDDYASTSNDPLAQRLFAEGTAEAQAELPSYNLGAWSLYQPGVDDDLSYHELVTGFLQQLCTMTKTPIYCATGAAFQADLKTPPTLSLMTTRLRPNRAADLDFTVSKPARVGITVLHNATTVFVTSANFSHGEHDFAVPALKPGGSYEVKLDATDLAGNYAQDSAPLTVSK